MTAPNESGPAATLLVTRASNLRRCWHPVAFAAAVGAEPVSRRLLGRDLVLWRPDGSSGESSAGEIRVAFDRCPHRWARLSLGAVVGGQLVCPYHGWGFAPDGRVAAIPQLSPEAPLPPAACLTMLATRVEHGLVWVCPEPSPEPLLALPSLPEYLDPRFRAIPVGVFRYATGAAAVIDNNTDATHVAFVHSESFGKDQDPRIPVSSVRRRPFGVEFTMDSVTVAASPGATGPASRETSTQMWLPFVQISRFVYSDGRTHILFKGCCPVDDDATDVHLTVLRNDVDDPASVSGIVEFERRVELEDKAMLDTLPAEFPLDPRAQAHSSHDRPGIAYRRALAEIL